MTSKRMSAVVENVKYIAVCLLMFLTMRVFLLQTFRIISGSMEDTLLIGDFLVVNKVAYGAMIPGTSRHVPGYAEPERGDAVVFRSNHDAPGTMIIKRLIGLPGDTISMNGGRVIVNSRPLFEPYTQHVDAVEDTAIDPALLWHQRFMPATSASRPYEPSREQWGPVVVPENNYFMMGDNRDLSYDSRYWGFVKRREIVGRADFIYFSWGTRPGGGKGPRLGRIGHGP